MDTGHQLDRYQLHQTYAQSIECAGGLPVAIPYGLDTGLIGQLLDGLDGLLFTGGDDLDPTRWGEALHSRAEPVDPARERFEFALLAEVERRRMPALCICLGCQVLNVHRGGTLIQFLPDNERAGAIEHRKLNPGEPPRHAVKIADDSLLARVIGGEELLANTYHKQAIAKLGDNLRTVATAPDGIIEAIEDPSLPFMLAVQWHPERIFTEPRQLRLFAALVDKCRECR